MSRTRKYLIRHLGNSRKAAALLKKRQRKIERMRGKIKFLKEINGSITGSL